jgi:hypothetical protein
MKSTKAKPRATMIATSVTDMQANARKSLASQFVTAKRSKAVGLYSQQKAKAYPFKLPSLFDERSVIAFCWLSCDFFPRPGLDVWRSTYRNGIVVEP